VYEIFSSTLPLGIFFCLEPQYLRQQRRAKTNQASPRLWVPYTSFHELRIFFKHENEEDEEYIREEGDDIDYFIFFNFFKLWRVGACFLPNQRFLMNLEIFNEFVVKKFFSYLGVNGSWTTAPFQTFARKGQHVAWQPLI